MKARRGSGVREPREGATEGGAPIDPSASLHPRLSATLIFLYGPRSIIPRHIRPLSSLFPPSPLIRCRVPGSPCSASLLRHPFFVPPFLPAVQPTVSPAPRPSSHPHPRSYATDCTFQIHYPGPCRRFARVRLRGLKRRVECTAPCGGAGIFGGCKGLLRFLVDVVMWIDPRWAALRRCKPR